MNSVQVLDTSNLEACGGTLARGDCGVGKEIFPDLDAVNDKSQ